MNPNLLAGVILLAVGVYQITCATWMRDFLFYRIQVGRMTRWGLSEGFTHTFYQVVGCLLMVAGLLLALGVWGPERG